MDLKHIRELCGYSIREVSRLSGINKNTYLKIEEENEIPERFKYAISRTFGDKIANIEK